VLFFSTSSLQYLKEQFDELENLYKITQKTLAQRSNFDR